MNIGRGQAVAENSSARRMRKAGFCNRRSRIRQTLEGSFSAVSKPNFASKYAFESSRRDLHNALLCTAQKSHFFQKISRICQILRNFSDFFAKFAIFKPIFCENFEIAAVQKDANLVELEKCCQTHILLQNFVLIQPRTSPPKFAKFSKNAFSKNAFSQRTCAEPRQPPQWQMHATWSRRRCTSTPCSMLPPRSD